jgi:hypothetical protein
MRGLPTARTGTLSPELPDVGTIHRVTVNSLQTMGPQRLRDEAAVSHLLGGAPVAFLTEVAVTLKG